MCGPANDEKQKIAREKFSEEFESAFVQTVASGIFSSASSPIRDSLPERMDHACLLWFRCADLPTC
jgi:hypothetical protein